jgi:poly-D-alanine transfer protein DltD
MKHAGSKFVLIMICFAVFIVVAATVYRWPMSLLYNSTKQVSQTVSSSVLNITKLTSYTFSDSNRLPNFTLSPIKPGHVVK